MKKLTSPTGKDIELSPIHNSTPVLEEYQKQLNDLVGQMTDNYMYWLKLYCMG